ncbi:protein LAZY 1-like [Lycium ferocissimum]|uniref:protein LAZY 1-like n=1 Tax=Lycium ferocissimum TaxID=112874 RepID=UPI002814B55C|nr:protein LAZY 1-like [Lycium ferocissimum]
MKLLGWMQSKLKQKGNEPANNTTILGNSITSFSPHKVVKSNGAEMVFQEQPSDEIFPGFLAIGTLGNYQTTNTDPPTPTFPMSFEHGETDITEKELKFINDELEKFLEEKVKEVAYESSESIITLSDKHMETGATECYVNVEQCPLQKYLFGSSVELLEIESEVKQQKGFLEELFKKKNIVQEGHVGNEGKEKKQAKGKHLAHFMKKMLRNLQYKSNSSTTVSSKGNITGSVNKRKLPQVLKMFHRKVHPVNENNLQDNETSNISACKAGNLGAISEVNAKFYPAATPKKEVISRERWIKTESDYLVLEL